MVPGRPGLRSVDSEHVERAIEPRKPLVEGADVVRRNGGSTEALYWPGASVPPGSQNVAGVQGSIQEPGRSHRLRRRASRPGPPVQQGPGLQARRPASCRKSKPTGAKRYRRAEGKRGGAGWAVGSRSVLIGPGKRANHPEGARGGKRGVRSRNCWRERPRKRRFPRRVSPRNCSG